MEIISPHDLPIAPIVEPMPNSGHLDRARGFTLVTAPLAAATAFVVLLIGITAFGVPVLSVAALLLALGGFALVWGVAFIAHTFVSPDGALLAHVLLTWGYLKREQKERHNRYGKHE
jgi:uncharacterized membrane protein HdeD (DUF308 family)